MQVRRQLISAISGIALLILVGLLISSYGQKDDPGSIPTGENDWKVANQSQLAPTDACKLSRSNASPFISTGFPRPQEFVPVFGNRKAAVLFVEFEDRILNRSLIDEWKFRQIPYAERTLSEMSYGKYELNFEVIENVYKLSKDSGSYLRSDNQIGSSSLAKIPLDNDQLVGETLGLADSDVDFSDTDFLVIVTPLFEKPVESGATGARGFDVDGKSNFLVVTGPYGDYFEREELDDWLLHETGHLMGLQHIYDFHRAAGAFDVMGNYIVSDTASFNDFIGWNKFFLGWLSNTQVNCLDDSVSFETFHRLTPIGKNSPDLKLILLKLSESEALGIELRHRSYLDEIKEGDEGVIIYKIDTKILDGQGMIEIVSNPSETLTDKTHGSSVLGTMSKGESYLGFGYKVEIIDSNSDSSYVSVQSQLEP